MKARVSALMLALLLTLSMVFPTYAQTTNEKDDLFKAVVLQLETYLENREDDISQLQGMLNTLDNLKGYSQSLGLKHYITVLYKIAENQFDWELTIEKNALTGESFERFREYLEEMRKYSMLGSVQNLIDYAEGRECENQGNIQRAINHYNQCLDFFDADDRHGSLVHNIYKEKYREAKQLLASGDLTAACFAFMEIAEYEDSRIYANTICDTLGYKPDSPDDVLKPVDGLRIKEATLTTITLTWKRVKHAAAYEIKQAGQLIGTVKENEFIIRDLTPSTKYTFEVVVKSGNIESQSTQVIGSTITFTSTPRVSPSPTPSPTPTLKASPTPTPTPKATPTLVLKLKISQTAGTHVLRWNSVKKASKYTIQRRRTNGSFKTIATVKETEYYDYDVTKGYRYYYRVIANLKDGQSIQSEEIDVVARGSDATKKPTKKPTKKSTKKTKKPPTTPPPPTTKPETTHTDSSTDTPAQQTVTEYRYRDSYQDYSAWSSWSSWSDKQETVSDSNLKEEQTKKQYVWWAAKCTKCGTNNPYHGSSSKCHGCSTVLANGAGKWVSVFAYTDDNGGTQSIYGRSKGRYFNGKPLWLTSDTVKKYRYRTRSIVTKWSSWTSWSTSKPESKSGREIETRKVNK